MDKYSGDRLNYKFKCGNQEDPDVERAYYSAVTVNQNVEGGVNLHVPAIQDSFLDTSEFYYKVAVQIVKPDGGKIPDGTEPEGKPQLDVFLPGGFLNNLWESCSVRLNGHPLKLVTSYPYVAQLLGVLSSSKAAREDVLGPLSGGIASSERTSLIAAADLNDKENFISLATIAGSREVVLYGRIYSDFLQTLAQLLPDTVNLDIELTRGRDSFALGSPNPDAAYKIKINSVTLFAKRVEFNKPAMKILRDAMGPDDYYLKYQQYDSRLMWVAKGSSTFNWSSVFPTTRLPKRVFFFLVDQSSFSGAINRLPTFCQVDDVAEVRFQVDGRDVLPEPFKLTDILYSVKPILVGLNTVTGGMFDNSTSAGLISEKDVTHGLAIYAANLPHAQSNSPRLGHFDLDVTFNSGTKRALTAICVGEFDQCIKISHGRDIHML